MENSSDATLRLSKAECKDIHLWELWIVALVLVFLSFGISKYVDESPNNSALGLWLGHACRGGAQLLPGAIELSLGLAFLLRRSFTRPLMLLCAGLCILHGFATLLLGGIEIVGRQPLVLNIPITPSYSISLGTEENRAFWVPVSAALSLLCALGLRATICTKEVVHLTTTRSLVEIHRLGKLASRWGIFALTRQQLPRGLKVRSILTLVFLRLSGTVLIQDTAAARFKMPLPWGVFTVWQALRGVRSTTLGSIELHSGQFILGERLKGRHVKKATNKELTLFCIHSLWLNLLIDVMIYRGLYGIAVMR
jgi:hypothetical protein